MAAGEPSNDQRTTDLRAKHYGFGWKALFVFIALGIVLEALHGLKVDWYLSTSMSTRRHMWTLAHAHGTLLGLINIAFASYVPWHIEHRGELHPWASRLFILATVVMPAGFFLGGIGFYAGDPGLGILLVPVGGLFLIAGVYLCAGFGRKLKP
ncbi:MAG: hypothetical protein ACR2QM_14165 [Longimicrobiales bacterium]